MEIGSILAEMSKESEKPRREERKPSNLLPNLSVLAIRNKYNEIDDFLLSCNPSFQKYYTGKPLLAFKHDVPTLGLLRSAYGENAPIVWLVPEILNVSEFCGCKDKFTKEQMRDTAGLITSAYPWLKVSELLLFFGWLKLGKYGKFYGCLDPMVITTALQDFLNDRAIYLSKIEQQERERKAEEDRKKPHYTRAEWEEKKRTQKKEKIWV